MVRYCRPNYLSELKIVVIIYIPDNTYHDLWNVDNHFEIDDDKLRNQVQPFFQQIERVTVKNVTWSRGHLELQFFHQIVFPNLKVVKFRNLNFNNTWLTLFPHQLMYSIVELRFINVKVKFKNLVKSQKLVEFERFINRCSNLEVFIHTGGEFNIIPVAKILARKFPNLRGFGYGFGLFKPFVIDENFRIFSNFTNLTEFHLKSPECINFHESFQFLPNIKVLSIWQVQHFRHPPVAVRRIVQSIRNIISERRIQHSANYHIHLIVNEGQYKEFKAVKNIDNFIHMTIVKGNVLE